MLIKANKKVTLEAKTLKIYCKVRDNFTASLVDAEGVLIHDQEDGYVPGFMPGDHYGDYVILNIDIDTGQVTNWRVPRAEQLEEWVNGAEGD